MVSTGSSLLAFTGKPKYMLSYLQLFRWPNLLVVVLTQVLFRYGIVLPLLASQGISPQLSHADFFILVLSTVLLCAAGYAINDYFDLRADRINKPRQIVLGRKISRRKAILYHSIFNLLGLLGGIYLSLRVGHWPLLLIFLVVPTLLWMYSIRYKKRFLIGNLLVALLSALVVSIVWVFESHALTPDTLNETASVTISYFSRIYALFAFLTTLTREVIKDIEDIKGDVKTGCRTIPIVSGIHATKRLVIFLILGMIFFVAWFQIYILRRDFDLMFTYLLLTVQIPFILMINKVYTAKEKDDYRSLSRFAKLIMVAGVITMFIFSFYLHDGFPLELDTTPLPDPAILP